MDTVRLKKFDAHFFDWMKERAENFIECPLPVTKGMLTVWETETPPAIPPVLLSCENIEQLYCWWLMEGSREMPFIPFIYSQDLVPYLNRVFKTPAGEPLPLWIYRYWQADPFLLANFSLEEKGMAARLIIQAVQKLVTQGKFLELEQLPQEVFQYMFETASDLPLPLPVFFKALWESNFYGAGQFDVSTKVGCMQLYLWFMAYQDRMPLRWNVPGFDLPPDSFEVDSETGMPPIAFAILQLWPSLEEWFSFKDFESRLDCYACLTTDVLASRADKPFYSKLFQTLLVEPLKPAFPLHPMLAGVWRKNMEGAKDSFNILTPEGAIALLLWAYTFGQASLQFLKNMPFDKELAVRLKEAETPDDPAFAKAALLVWPEQLKSINADKEEDRRKLYEILFGELLKERKGDAFYESLVRVFAPWLKESGIFSIKAQMKPEKTESRSDENGVSAAPQFKSGGVNLIGFIKGELGLGEDVRMGIKSCISSNVPYAAINSPLLIGSRQEAECEGSVAEKPLYDANIIFMPGIETMRTYYKAGPGLFQGKYNIGMWQWELPHWPKKMLMALPLVQEVWASSRFVQQIMEPVMENVAYIPLAVEIPEFQTDTRQSHGLPVDEFLFLYAFDGFSWGERKNPLATINAFQAAFPQNRDVRLIVKTMNANDSMPFWRKIKEAAEKDRRIICLNEVYSRNRVCSLMNNCDAYVSLHRSEGFGRTMAEAMLLEKPVIATAWSGNADYTTSETAFAISGKLIPLKKDDYLFWENQYWCDPDHDEAVSAMRETFANGANVRQKIKAAKSLISTTFSPQNVGRLYRQRLEQIGIL